jgi:DNA primase
MRWIDALVERANANLTEERELEALWVRGCTDDQIQGFRIGYLDGPPSGIDYPEDFVSWAKVGRKLEDVFVFPLTNSLGQVKGVQFRHVDRKAKGYTDYFVAKDEPAFFGLGQAMPHVWATQKACLVEGAFDLFPVQRVFPFTIPTMTSTVSSGFLRFLKRNVREVWFGYDMDSAGRKGSFEFVKEHRDEFERIRTPQFPQVRFADGRRAKDPGDLWEIMGDERLSVYLKTAFEQQQRG